MFQVAIEVSRGRLGGGWGSLVVLSAKRDRAGRVLWLVVYMDWEERKSGEKEKKALKKMKGGRVWQTKVLLILLFSYSEPESESKSVIRPRVFILYPYPVTTWW